MSRGKTYAVRNTYGYIEYLTQEEIENLQERGEDLEVVGSQCGRPPTAKNPANQERVNQLWYEERERKARERKGRKKIAKGIASAAIAVSGAYSDPPHSGGTTLRVTDALRRLASRR